MLNILSGLQEGSRSVCLVSRSGPAGAVKGAVVCPGATANTVALADSASMYGIDAEYVFEDTQTQTSGKYTTAYGRFEAETDQFGGTPAIGTFLKYGTTTAAGKLIAATMPTDIAIVCAKTIDSYTLPVNPTMLSGVGGVAVSVLRIKTL